MYVFHDNSTRRRGSLGEVVAGASISPDAVQAISSKGFDPNTVLGAAGGSASSMGLPNIQGLIQGYSEDFKRAADGLDRKEYGVVLQGAAPGIADAVCGIFEVPPGQCSGAVRSIGKMISDIADMVGGIFRGTDWRAYHLNSSQQWQKNSAAVIALAKLVAMKEKDALSALLAMFKAAVERKYCYRGWGPLIPTDEIQSIFLRHYRANAWADKGARELIPTAWSGKAKGYLSFSQGNERFCVPPDPHGVELNSKIPGSAPSGYRIPDIWLDRDTILDLGDPHDSWSRYGGDSGGNCTPTNFNPAASIGLRPPEGSRYFILLSCTYQSACGSSERWSGLIPWYITDLQRRNEDIDVALGESMPEVMALVDSWARKMNLHTCEEGARLEAQWAKDQRAAESARIEAENDPNAISRGAWAAAEKAASASSAKVDAQIAEERGGSWVPWVLGAAAIAGLYGYSRWKKSKHR